MKRLTKSPVVRDIYLNFKNGKNRNSNKHNFWKGHKEKALINYW